MAEYNSKHTLAAKFKEYERRLRSLETAPQMAFRSIENGAIKEYDTDGNLVSQYGQQFDGTHTAVSLTGPTPPAPAEVSAEGAVGGIDVAWGGSFVGGALTPMDYAWIEIYVSTVSGFDPMPANLVGTIVSSQKGKQFIAAPDGATRYVVLITRTQSGKFSEASVEVSATPISVEAAEITPPAVPTGLSVVGTWEYNSNWIPTATFTHTWTPVTQDANGNPVTVDGYEVWCQEGAGDWAFLGASATNSFEVAGLKLDTTYNFKVRANKQVPGDFSTSATSSVSSASVTETVPTPKAPVFGSKLGLVEATYYGVTTTNAAPPDFVVSAEFGVKTTAGGTYTVVGTLTDIDTPTRKLTLTTDLAPGATFYGAVRYATYSGTKGAWSEDTGNPRTLKGVVDADLVDTTINQQISNLTTSVSAVQTAANGKNRVWYATTKPTGTNHNAGDTWFDTDDGNKQYRWDTTASDWLAVPVGSAALDSTIITSINNASNAATAAQTAANGKNKINYGTAAPTAATPGRPGDIFWVRTGNTITGQYLNTAGTGTTSGNTWVAQTLTNSTIATLDAAKITTGELDAARIAAKSITSDKMVISASQNLHPDPLMLDAARWGGSTGVVVNAGAGKDGQNALFIPAAAGQTGAYYGANAAQAAQVGTNFEPGTSVFVSAWFYSATAMAAGTARIYARLYNPTTGASIATPSFSSTEAIPAATWTKITGTITLTGAGAVNPMRVVFGLWTTHTADVLVCAPEVKARAAGELIVDGAITADKILAGSLTSASGVFGDLNAASITSGTLNAARIGARTISADKVLIGYGDNLLPNGSFETGGTQLWHSNLTWVATDRPPGLPGSLVTNAGQGTISNAYETDINLAGFDVTPGEEYLFEVWLRADTPDSRIYLEVRDQAGEHAAIWSEVEGETHGFGSLDTSDRPYPVENWIVPTVWTHVVVSGVFNGNVVRARMGSWYFNHPNGTNRNAKISVGGVRLRRRVSGELIVDGSVTARTIASEAVQTNALAANAVTAGKIQAGAIEVDKLQVGTPVGVSMVPNSSFETTNFAFSPVEHIEENGVIDYTFGNSDIELSESGTVQVSRLTSWSYEVSGDNVQPPTGKFFLEAKGIGSNTTSSYASQTVKIIKVTREGIGGQAYEFKTLATAYDHLEEALNSAQKNANNNRDKDKIKLTMNVYDHTGGIPSLVYVDSTEKYLTDFANIFVRDTYSWTEIGFSPKIPEEFKFCTVEFIVETTISSFGRAIALDNVQVYSITGATFISEGSITADKIAVGQITSDKLSSDAIDGKIITGSVIRTSEDVGVTNLTTAWLGTANNSASTVSGPSLATRTNRIKDPAGKLPANWVQTDGTVAKAGLNLFGRGASVYSSNSALTCGLVTPANGALTVQAQFTGSLPINAYVHEAGTSLDGTKFTLHVNKPAGTASNSRWWIAKNNRHYWIPNTTTNATHKFVSIPLAGGTAHSTQFTGRILTYDGRPISPVNSVIWGVDGESSSTSFTGTIQVKRAAPLAAATAHTVGASSADSGRFTITNESFYAVWTVETDVTIIDNPYYNTPRTKTDYYMQKVSADGTVGPVRKWHSITYEGTFGSGALSSIKASLDNAIYIKAFKPGTLAEYNYYKILDSGARYGYTASQYNAIADKSYPDDLNGSAKTFTYSTVDSQLGLLPRTQTNAQKRYLESSTGAIYTYDTARAKHSVGLGLATPNDTSWVLWSKTYNWSTIPNPVITFQTNATGSSFIAENTSIRSFWFSGDTSDAGGGAGGILDVNGLRGYAPNGGLSTELNFNTGILSATGANIEGVIKASDAAGTTYVQLIDGKIRFYSANVLRATVDHTNFEDTGWITLPLTSSFELYTAGSEVTYRKIGKVVYLCGVVKPTATGVTELANGGNSTIGTIPAAYRPSALAGPQVFVCQGSINWRWALTINTSGTLVAGRFGYGNGHVSGSTSTGADGQPATTTRNWFPFTVSWALD